MTIMVRKDVVLACGSYRNLKYAQDYDLTMRIIANNPEKDYYTVPEALVEMRTDQNTYKRRGGFIYAKLDLAIQKDFYKNNYITFFEYMRNVFVRVSVRLMPTGLRTFIYKKGIRKRV